MFNSPISSLLIENFLVNTEIKIPKCSIELSNLKYNCLFFHTSENSLKLIACRIKHINYSKCYNSFKYCLSHFS